MKDEPSTTSSEKASKLERILNLMAEVRAGEGVTVVLMFLNIFLILTAYYVLKVVREALTIGGVEVFGLPGDEIKAYLPAVMAVLFVVIVPAYGYLASRVDRLRLIKSTMIGVAAVLGLFFVWGSLTGVGTAIGLSFYLFLGVINVFLIAQFWSYANDIYREEQGKRLFAIVAVGQSLGAVLGPKIASIGADYTFSLMVLSGVILLASVYLYTLVDRRVAESDALSADTEEKKKPLKPGGGFALVFSNRYLLYIALMILCTNVVNTTGEYILSNAAKTNADTEAPVSLVVDDLSEQYTGGAREEVPEAWQRYFAEADLTPGLGARVESEIDSGAFLLTDDLRQAVKDARSPIITRFYGDFFFIVNILGLLIQMFFVSRIFKYFGVRAALFVLPVIAFVGYGAIGILGGLFVLRVAKTAENSVDYSLQNTIKQALFLPTSREAKYKAKAAIDTFFVRFGDAASAGLVALGLHVLDFGPAAFAMVNVVLCLVWIALNVGIAKEHKKLVSETSEGPQ